MEKAYQISAAVLIGAAAYFLWSGNNDGVFISVALACVCYFLRFRIKISRGLPKPHISEEDNFDESGLRDPDAENSGESGRPAEYADR